VKQKIDKLSRGIFEYSLPEIVLSESKLQFSVVAGATYRGSFLVSNTRGSRMKGIAYSSSRFVTLSYSQFVGESNKIEYSFKSEFVDPGHTVSGTINLVTDCGEAALPFEFTVMPPYCQSSVGEIRNLFQLANLAKADWNEAERLFESAEIVRALPYYDKDIAETYRHLRPSRTTGRALEEMLISIRKKVGVTLTVDKPALEYSAGAYSFLDKLVLTRNVWGYLEYKVSSNADFISPKNHVITSELFAGNTFELDIVIDPAKLHAGLNLGQITIESINDKIVIPVICHGKSADSAAAMQRRRIKQNYSKLMANYLRFRLNRQSLAHYVNEAENILTGLQNMGAGEELFFKVYRGHLLLSSGKESAFKELLQEFEEKKAEYKKDPVAYAGGLYLSAMHNKNAEETDAAVREISALYTKYPEKWMLLWFLLYLDRSFNSPENRIEAIKEAFYQGAKSPILYYEAATAYNEEPDCLTELCLFELQVFAFSIRNTMLAQGVAAKFAFTAMKAGEYGLLLQRILEKTYELYSTKDILQALCHNLMLGERVDEKAHVYYAKAIGGELALQGLQEYYLKSAPGDISALLDRNALNYFAINSTLDDDCRAFLYANVVKNYKEYGQLWKLYEPTIFEYTYEKLRDGAISRNLAFLYDELIPKMPFTAELASLIPNVCFYYEITDASKELIGVHVSHKELEGEALVPLVNGSAFIELFTEKADVIFSDTEGNRYTATVDFRINKLVHLDYMLEKCCKADASNPKLLLYVAEKMHYDQRKDETAVEVVKRLTRIPNLRADYVRDCVKELIYYYYDNFEGDLLESYLLQIDLRLLDQDERTRIIEFMIIRDLYNVALKAMDEYGFEGIDEKRLMKLCSRLLMNAGGMERVDVLVSACFYVFREGRYDDTILSYLNDYYYGTTEDMYAIWQAAHGKGLDTIEMEERLLAQMLFTETYITSARSVFTNYYRSGSNKVLIKAYLSYYAYKYLVNDRLVEPEIFDIMRSEIRYDENEICLLAVLKWYSTSEQLTDSEVNFVDYHLNRLEQREMILPFMSKFKDTMRISQDICDKYYVEYRTMPGSRVTIHYTYEDGSGNNSYTEEEMRHVCYGIYVKEFVIFANEALQYYITEATETGDVIKESTEIRPNLEQNIGDDTKFYQLNMIISAREMQDERTALKLLDNYIRTDYAISKLFTPI